MLAQQCRNMPESGNTWNLYANRKPGQAWSWPRSEWRYQANGTGEEDSNKAPPVTGPYLIKGEQAMSNIIDFVVRFQQQGLAGVSSASNSLLGAVNRSMSSTQQQARNTTVSIAEMNRQLDALRRRRDISVDTRQITAANREIAQLEGRIANLSGGGGNGGGGGMMGFLKGGLIAGAVATVAYAAKKIGLDSISAAMNFNSREKSFEVLTGNAAHGRQMANDLRDMKMNSLVGGGVYQNAQTLLGFGTNEGSILRKIHEVGDVGMGDTDKMQSLTLARAQITAAGKLQGQDLLQLVNAGFNPLNVMAENWQKFGFKTKQTVGTLKDLMSEGGISSEMVDKAFTVATSKGGRFYQMMDQIGETAGGKMLKLKGAWAATQIDIGNSLMPLATNAMQAATSLLHLIHIGETVPESLRTEKLEANTLVQSIQTLNEKSVVRGQLIDQLKAKYPDFFGEIDKEKVKNQELLSILDKVNGAYDKRIDMAEHMSAGQVQKDEAGELLQLAQKARMQAEYGKTHTGFLDRTKYLTVYDRFFKEKGLPNPKGDMSYEGLLELADEAEKKAQSLTVQAAGNDSYVTNAKNNDLINEAFRLAHDPSRQHTLWGSGYKGNSQAFSVEMANLRKMYAENGGKFQGSNLTYDYTKLRGLVHPDGTAAGDGALAAAADDGGKKITGGGNRQVIINLNAPMIKEQVFHVGSMSEAKEYSFEAQEEILLRLLQSAKRSI